MNPKNNNNAVVQAIEEARRRQAAIQALLKMNQNTQVAANSTPSQSKDLLSFYGDMLKPVADLGKSAGQFTLDAFGKAVKPVADLGASAWESASDALKINMGQDSWIRDFIDPKLFDDGYDFGDVSRSILGTAVDAGTDFIAGVGEGIESIIDAAGFGGGYIVDKTLAPWFYPLMDAFTSFVLGRENEHNLENQWNSAYSGIIDIVKSDLIKTDEYQKHLREVTGYDWEQESILGEHSDNLVQSVPPLIANAYASAHGFPSWIIPGLNAFGGKAEQVLNEGATDDEAFFNALITAMAEVATEKISSGILPGGGSSLDDILMKSLSKIPSKTLRNGIKFLVSVGGEGIEEMLAEDASTIADWLTHKSDQDLIEMLTSDEAWKNRLYAGLGGMILGGGSEAINIKKSGKSGRDAVTGLTANEETVVKAETERRAAEYKVDGKKANIEKIRAEVIEAMKRGDISLEAIESSLGGEVYRRYTEAKTKQKGIRDELKRAAATIDALYGKADLTEQEQAELDKAVQSLSNLSAQEKALKVDDARQNLRDYVNNLTKTQGDAYLRESYSEAAKRGEGFKTDKVYRAKSKKNQAAVDATIESAKKAGLNNTRRVHELVDFAAKISADTGLVFDLSNNKRIKDAFVQRQTAEIQKLEAIPEAKRTDAQKKTLEEMRELLEKVKSDDITINGTNSGKAITLNLDSPNPLNRIAGHEISHSLENAKAYDALRDSLLAYAKSKGVDTDKLLSEYRKRYQGANDADAEREMIADMVGDYLFSDENFVKHLTKNRNLFQRVYDNIKYMLKLATTGSKEAKELERVKHLFDKAYKQMAAGTDTTTQYSFSSMSHTFFGNEDMSTLDWKNADYKSTEGYQAYVDKCLDNYRQTRPDFDEASARKSIEKSIDGIVRVAIAAKEAGYDIYDDAKQRNTHDSKNRLLFSSLEPNSDYITSSDISTICDKRKNFTEIYEDIVRAEEKLGVPENKRFFHNVDNYFYIHQVMAEKGLTTPCRECYVESMRKNLAPMAENFLKLVNETDPNNTANDQLYHQKGKDKGKLKVGNAETKEFVLAALEEYGMTPGDLSIEKLSTAPGLAELKITAPNVYEAFNSFYGQSKPKMPRSATPFRFGELTALLTDNNGKINKRLVEKINHTGGFRLQSYSDFQVENFTDVLQVLFEAGTLGLKGHAYTKVPAFLEATDNTNLKRNISIFMYKDGDQWKLDRNDSFPYTLEEIYKLVDSDKSGNTGIIAVSQNAEMSAWIMANDHIGYGIPYHKSGQKMDVVRDTTVTTEDGRKVKGYTETKDHTRQQSEVWAKANSDHKALTKVKKGIDIYEFWDFDNQAGLSKTQLIEKNVKAYLDACEKRGYLPKFREYVLNNQKVLEDVLRYSKELGFAPQDATIDDISFRHEVRDASGKLVRTYRVPYGYYKFLGDFGMFTPDGKASPQKTLSLEDYDFDKAVDFFADADTLRRNEILQQFANGKLREEYRNSDLTTEQLEQLAKRKRDEVVREVVGGDIAPESYSLSDSTAPLAPMNNFDTFGKDLKREGYSPDTAPVKAEARKDIAPVRYSVSNNNEQQPVADRIRKQMDKDLAQLRDRYEPKIQKAKLAAENKGDTVKRLAWDLLTELQTMKKGKRVSPDLGYLLDNTVKNKEPAEYRSLEIALKNIRDNPLEVVNPRSKAERFARQILERKWQETVDYASDLEQEYRQGINDLATRANRELDATTGNPVAPIAQNMPTGSNVAPVAPTSQKSTKEGKSDTIGRVMANDGPRKKQKSGIVMKLRNNLVDKGSVVDDIAIKTGNREIMGRYKAIGNAAAKAQHLIGKGNEKAGVKSLTEIQSAVKKVATEAEFDDYMYNRLNVDRMTMAVRYPGRHDFPVFSHEYSAANSRATVQAYEAKYPEFRGLANDVYTFVRYNLTRMIREGMVSAETANLWNEMYPHYIPIERAGIDDTVTHNDGRTGAYNPIKGLIGSERKLRPMFTAIADQTIAVEKAIAKNRFGKELRRVMGMGNRTTGANGPVSGILDEGTVVYTDARGNGKVVSYDEVNGQYLVKFKHENGRSEDVWLKPEELKQMAPDTAMDEALRGFFNDSDLLKPPKGEENPVFTIFEGGKRIEFDITPDMYDALKPTSAAMAKAIPVLSQVTNARKRILTDLNPVFWLTNTPKDIQAILPNSQHPGATYGNLPNAAFQIASKGKWYREYVENGGKQQSYFNEEERRLEKEPGTAKRILTGPARFIRSINENLEMLPRLAEYIASRKKGASIDVAMLDAARVTTDFSAAGDLSRAINRNAVPFFTASISGAAQQVRNFREAKAKGAKGIAGYIMRQAIATIPLAIFNHLVWEDDEEYAELSDYVKQNYYIVGKTDDGKFIRIPKGREVAVIQDFYEQMANLVTGNFDDVDVGSFAQLAMTNIAPNNPIDNNILAPIIQAHTGKTWYGEDLIPTRLQKVPNAEQYDESTDAISKWIGEMTGMSPYRINYILDQYSGGFGDVILPMLTKEAESGSDTIGDRLLAPLADKFTVDSTMKNQYVSDFYDKVDELEINSNSQSATDEDILMSAYMNGRNSAIGDLYGLRRKVNSAVTVGDLQDIAEDLKPYLDHSTDPGLWYALNYGNQNAKIPDSSKYQIVRSIQRMIDDRAKAALDTYQNVDIDGAYATVGTDHYLKKDGNWGRLSSEQVEEQKLMTNVLGIKPEMYWNSKAAFSGFRNDKDANGRTRKDKIIDWINSQDMPYEAKIILYKSQYTGDHTYDAEIIEYLQSNPNITYDQMVTILKDLKLMN